MEEKIKSLVKSSKYSEAGGGGQEDRWEKGAGKKNGVALSIDEHNKTLISYGCKLRHLDPVIRAGCLYAAETLVMFGKGGLQDIRKNKNTKSEPDDERWEVEIWA